MVVMETISRQLVWAPIQKRKKEAERVTFLLASLIRRSTPLRGRWSIWQAFVSTINVHDS
jgi:hypothetical protein